jgi:hypothetical protein
MAGAAALATTLPPPERVAQGETPYESCAVACQRQVDGELAQCPGYREILDPAKRLPPPPNCRRGAIEAFEQCLARCPGAPVSASG